MLKKTDYKQKQEELRMLLETITTAAGKQTKFVQKKSKMTAACFGQTMVLGCLEKPDASLIDLAQVSADLDVEITASGLNQRINERGKGLLTKILAKSIQMRRIKEIEPELLQQFTAVQILAGCRKSIL